MKLLADDTGRIDQLLLTIPSKEILLIFQEFIQHLLYSKIKPPRLFILYKDVIEESEFKSIVDICDTDYISVPKISTFSRDIGLVSSRRRLMCSKNFEEKDEIFSKSLEQLLDDSCISINYVNNLIVTCKNHEIKYPIEGGHIATTKDYVVSVYPKKNFEIAITDEVEQNWIFLSVPDPTKGITGIVPPLPHIDLFFFPFQKDKSLNLFCNEYNISMIQKILHNLSNNTFKEIKGKIEIINEISTSLETYCGSLAGKEFVDMLTNIKHFSINNISNLALKLTKRYHEWHKKMNNHPNIKRLVPLEGYYLPPIFFNQIKVNTKNRARISRFFHKSRYNYSNKLKNFRTWSTNARKVNYDFFTQINGLVNQKIFYSFYLDYSNEIIRKKIQNINARNKSKITPYFKTKLLGKEYFESTNELMRNHNAGFRCLTLPLKREAS